MPLWQLVSLTCMYLNSLYNRYPIKYFPKSFHYAQLKYALNLEMLKSIIKEGPDPKIC